MAAMKAFRRLAAILGCLAVISAMLPLAAFGWTRAADAAPARTAVSDFCPNCHDCDPCRAVDATCAQVCVSPLPTLGASGPALPAIAPGDVGVPAGLAVLHGLSPPPDPFPPRS